MKKPSKRLFQISIFLPALIITYIFFTSSLKIHTSQMDKKTNILKESNHRLEIGTEKEITKSEIFFDENNVLTKSNVSLKDLALILRDTGLEGLEEYYLLSEESLGINALFLAALTAHESAWGESERCIEQNNLSGYAVYSPSSKGRSFKSKGESILETAKLLKENYLTNGASYFKGYSVKDINSSYCPSDYTWSKSIIEISKNFVNEIKSSSL